MVAGSEHFFIVVEGMDGSGKTGITRQLRQILSHTHGDNVALTYEPHDPSAAGLYIRNALTKRIKVTPLALALAFALNRADHIARVIEPFFNHKQPRIIVSDRYYLSSLVYQSTGGLTMEDVFGLNQWARRPDLTIFLNVSPQKCYERMRNRPQDKELFEKNLGERLEKYGQGIALLREKGDLIVEVDANPDFPQVLNNVLDTVTEHAPDWVKIQRPLIVSAEEDGAVDLSIVSDKAITDFVDSMTSTDDLSSSDSAKLFKAYVMAQGFEWGQKLKWTDANAYALMYRLPLGFEQHGIALILDATQQTDLITKTIQTMLDHKPEKSDISRLSDFMIVLDNGRWEPVLRYDREGSSEARISPQVTIVNRDMLIDWLEKK